MFLLLLFLLQKRYRHKNQSKSNSKGIVNAMNFSKGRQTPWIGSYLVPTGKLR